MANLINGKEISLNIRNEIKAETEAFVEKTGVRPGLAVIIVGEDPASQVYVRNKKRACDEVGFYSESYELPENTTQEELNALVDKLNANDKIHGKTRAPYYTYSSAWLENLTNYFDTRGMWDGQSTAKDVCETFAEEFQAILDEMRSNM